MAGLLDVFTGDFKASGKTAEVLIAPLDADGKIDSALGGAKILQFWPETLAESRTPNWQSKEIPGAPTPLYQWMSTGERSFSFTAIFSRDMDGEIGSDVDEDKYNVDIDAAKAWLYLLSSGDYKDSGDMKAATSPPILFMAFLGSKIGYNDVAPAVGGYDMTSGIHCVMNGLDIETRNWFPSGRPRLMSASLTFVEVIQIGKGVYPYGRKTMLDLASKYTRTPSS